MSGGVGVGAFLDGYRAATRQTIRRTLAPGPGTNGQQGYDALYITPDHIDERLVTHVSRAPDDLREGDTTSVNLVDRGVLGEDKTFDEGHEISGRFDNAYGIYSCIAQSCTLNISDTPGAGITDMAGWVFTPTSYTGAGGGTRAPQVTVADSDYRWFGFWLRGADPSAEDGFEVRTFSGGSQTFDGDPSALSGGATYIGPAAGQYVKEDRAGLFTAKGTLHANFGASPTISGGLSDFRDGSRSLGWHMAFEAASIGSAGGFSGRTHGTTYVDTYQGTDRYRDEDQDNHGLYVGKLYGSATPAHPTGVSGTLYGLFDDGAVAGGYGASWKMDRQ